MQRRDGKEDEVKVSNRWDYFVKGILWKEWYMLTLAITPNTRHAKCNQINHSKSSPETGESMRRWHSYHESEQIIDESVERLVHEDSEIKDMPDKNDYFLNSESHFRINNDHSS